MKKRFFLFCLFLSFSYAQSQPKQIDEYEKKRLLEGTANNPIERNYSEEQLKKFRERLKTLVTNAKGGDTNAMVVIGNLFYFGTGNDILRQDLQVAYKWYKKASDLGNEEASYNLGICYYYGSGTKKDEKKALELFETAIEKGLYEASYKVARIFESRKNFKKARKFYEYSVKFTKNINALRKLAHFYMNGIGGEKQEKQAFDFYKRTAFVGDAHSQYMLAKIYFEGEITDVDEKKALSFLEMAANNGNSQAQFQLANLYLSGEAKYIKNDDLALAWAEKSAKSGNANAQLLLGDIYDGTYGIKADPKKAYKYYRLVAHRGEVQAMLKLGLFLELGRGVKADYAKALSWYEKAAEKSYVPAVLRLGYSYENGSIVARDMQKALSYYEKAVKLGSGKASVYLAKIYKDGRGGVKKNRKKALALLKKAAIKAMTQH